METQKINLCLLKSLWAPSFELVVRFRCTIGKFCDLTSWCPPLLFSAPIDLDFFGESSTVESPAAAWLRAKLSASTSLTAMRLHCGQTNCRRYSVLSFVMVFLKRPDSPVDWKEKRRDWKRIVSIRGHLFIYRMWGWRTLLHFIFYVIWFCCYLSSSLAFLLLSNNCRQGYCYYFLFFFLFCDKCWVLVGWVKWMTVC